MAAALDPIIVAQLALRQFMTKHLVVSLIEPRTASNVSQAGDRRRIPG
jgi:hypothetical protein